MKKHLMEAGNTWQLYLNKPIVQLLGINEQEYSVILKIENKCLLVKKAHRHEIFKSEKNFLIKKLIKRSSGYGLNIPQPILELLEINPEKDLLDIEINEDMLRIRKT